MFQGQAPTNLTINHLVTSILPFPWPFLPISEWNEYIC